MKEGLQYDRVFTNINHEGVGGPMTKSLDSIVRPASDSEVSSAAGTQGVAGNVGGKQGAKALQKPGTSRGEPTEVSHRARCKRNKWSRETRCVRKKGTGSATG